MPLSDEQRAWAEKKLSEGASEDEVFGFLAQDMNVDLSGPQGIGAGPMIDQPQLGRQGNPVAAGAADIERANKQYQRGLVRGIPAAAAGLALSPLTGGMSLPAAMATDFAGMTGADLLTQTVMKGLDPSREINPLESAKVGVWGAGTGGAVRAGLSVAQRTLGAIGGIPKGAINEVNQTAPLGGPKAYGMVKNAPADAEFALANQARDSIQKARSPSFPQAEAAVGAYQKDVDTAPIYGRILQRLRAKPVNAAEEAANKSLEDLADRLPDKMTMTELEDYLQRIRVPVKDQMGQVGGSLKTNDVKDLSSFIRQYRDKLLAGEPASEAGPGAFVKSSREMESIKQFRKLLLDKSGNLRRSAENTVRRLPSNRTIMGVFDRYDAAMGTDFGQKARALALKRQFNPTDLKDAGSLIEMLSRIDRAGSITSRLAGPPARALTKGMSVVLPPRGFPSRSAAATEAFRSAMEQEEGR